jgi:hypothetical protein
MPREYVVTTGGESTLLAPLLAQLRPRLAELDVVTWSLALEASALVVDILSPPAHPLPASLAVAGHDVRLRVAPLAGETPGPHVKAVIDELQDQREPEPSEVLRPGARIFFGDGSPTPSAAGVVTALLNWRKRSYLLTCAHGLRPGVPEIFGADRSTVVARVVRDGHTEAYRIDAALAELTEEGAALVAPHAWLEGYTAPDLSHAGLSVEVRMSSGKRNSTIASPVVFRPELFQQSVPFILTSRCTRDADSGAPLYITLNASTLLYGLCTGFVGEGSYFTPVVCALRRFLA